MGHPPSQGDGTPSALGDCPRAAASVGEVWTVLPVFFGASSRPPAGSRCRPRSRSTRRSRRLKGMSRCAWHRGGPDRTGSFCRPSQSHVARRVGLTPVRSATPWPASPRQGLVKWGAREDTGEPGACPRAGIGRGGAFASATVALSRRSENSRILCFASPRAIPLPVCLVCAIRGGAACFEALLRRRVPWREGSIQPSRALIFHGFWSPSGFAPG